ncbi:hypothetical protein ZWY2020_033320 [Hordeum vulgare]|nr:hypothetical protein ZWY2020_033320 [Hordeum vulgare]
MLRGVWLLQKLMVNFYDWGGSNRGPPPWNYRAIMESHLPAQKEKKPDLEVVTQLVRAPRHHQASRTPKPPRRTISRILSTKGNKLLKLHFHVSPWRTQTDATNAMARTHEVVKSLTLKSLHNNESYGEI